MSAFSLLQSRCIDSVCSIQNSCFSKTSPAYLIPLSSRITTCVAFVLRSRGTRLSFRSVLDKRGDGFSSFAVMKRRHSGSGPMESDGFDDDDEDGDDDNEDWGVYDVGGDEDDNEGMFMPLGEMKKWLENKPRGFGEGKVYDTSIEDKLLDEIEQSRQAQAANLNKLKNKPVQPEPKPNNRNAKGLADSQIGIRVRVSDLPKKKNVHRDLVSAFKGVSGILDIIPAVSASKKTRDPICKGFAFVDFKTDVDANRFVELFSGQRISFGKVQKQIKCRVVNSCSNESSCEEECSDNGLDEHELPFSGSELESNAYFVAQDAFSASLAGLDEPDYSDEEPDEIKAEGSQQNLVSNNVETPRQPRQDSETHLNSPKQLEKIQAMEGNIQEEGKIHTALVSLQETKFNQTTADADLGVRAGRVNTEDIKKNLKPAGAEKLRDVDDKVVRPIKGSAKPSDEDRLLRIKALEQKLLARGKQWGGSEVVEPEEKQERIEKKNDKKKKILTKGKAKKAPKLEISGSSKRLKIKEKAVLTGVLSKYSTKAASNLK